MDYENGMETFEQTIPSQKAQPVPGVPSFDKKKKLNLQHKQLETDAQSDDYSIVLRRQELARAAERNSF